MYASLNHGCRKMMRAGNHIGDDLGLGGIRYGRFQHAHDGGRTLAELHSLADDRWIAIEGGLPKAVGENGGTGGIRAIVAHVEQTSENRMKPHHLEIRAAHDPGANLAGVAKADHRKTDDGEVAELADRFDAAAKILNLRHGKVGVFHANAFRALAD